MNCGPNFPFLLPNVSLKLLRPLYSHPFSLWKRSNILICDVKLYRRAREEESEQGDGAQGIKINYQIKCFKIAILTAINKIM